MEKKNLLKIGMRVCLERGQSYFQAARKGLVL